MNKDKLFDKAVILDQGDPEEGHNSTLKVEIDNSNGVLFMRPEGYGDSHSFNGQGWPIALEIWEGELRLIVWGDINSDEYTHIIPLEGAREDRRDEE